MIRQVFYPLVMYYKTSHTNNFVPEHLKNKFVKGVRDISSLKNGISRSVALNKESAVDLHVFGDARIVASCAVVYGVVHQQSNRNRKTEN